MKFLSLILAFLICSSVFPQDLLKDKKYIFEFRDGTTIIGTYLYNKEGNIWIKDLLNDLVYLIKVMVAQVHVENNIVNGEYWFPNLHETYFFSPSPLEKGEGYLDTPTFSYGKCSTEYQRIFLSDLELLLLVSQPH